MSKRKLDAIVYAIPPEYTGASHMTSHADKQLVNYIVNLINGLRKYDTHELNKYNDYFVVSFIDIADIDAQIIKEMLEDQTRIRDIKVKQVPAKDSKTNTAFFELHVECYNEQSMNKRLDMPLYFELDIIKECVTKSSFACVALDDSITKAGYSFQEADWKDEWNGSYNFVNKAMKVLCNISETPDDVTIDISRQTIGTRIIYEITAYGVSVLSYSVIEYIDAVKPDGIAWNYQYTTDHFAEKNCFKIRLTNTTPSESSFVINGQYYTDTHIRRHSLPETEQYKKHEDITKKSKLSHTKVQEEKEQPKSTLASFLKFFFK